MNQAKTVIMRTCKNCGKHYTAKRSTSKYCSDKCRAKAFQKRQGYQFKDVIREVKADYPKLTFRLSVFGFIASLAFYIGVLRDLAGPKDAKDIKIEQLQEENVQLKDTIQALLSEYQK